jgi:hypothetical protein
MGKKKKIGLFFGAGAEISYGLPSGGRFALDIFRQNPNKYKEHLRKILKNIDKTTSYATDWLPDSYYNKRIHAFGKNEFQSLIESSIENNKSKIIDFINDFDKNAEEAINTLKISADEIKEKFRTKTNIEFGTRKYSQLIKVNSLIAEQVKLFNSEYYSAILDLIKDDTNNAELKKYASSFLQLLIAAYGNDLIQKLNQELFTEAPDDIDIFDDITGLFKMEYSKAGLNALEILLEEKKNFDLSNIPACSTLFAAVAQKMLENLFSTILDYQSIIDSHFRYLFSPRKEWAKFTKMVIFLYTVRSYIAEK